MIQDMAKVSLFDGTHLPAIEVYPGKELLSPKDQKLLSVTVKDRTIVEKTEVITLILSSGRRLTGSRDQKVAVHRRVNLQFVPLLNIEIGDRLRGERAGIPTIVDVIGLSFDTQKPVRLVGLLLDDKNFVADGVLCR